jgi:hypothetical protein
MISRRSSSGIGLSLHLTCHRRREAVASSVARSSRKNSLAPGTGHKAHELRLRSWDAYLPHVGPLDHDGDDVLGAGDVDEAHDSGLDAPAEGRL